MTFRLACTALVGGLLVTTGISAQDADSAPAIKLGNGESNWIIVDGIQRKPSASTFAEARTAGEQTYWRRGDGVTLIIPEVQIDGDGWLVMHPFVDGKPNGTYVAGYSFVESGTNKNVAITLNPAPSKGDRYVIMLHKDVDKDRVFDFVFVAENVVEDKAVFEGGTMIAHIVTVP